MIELRNARIDHHLRVFGHGHGAFQDLGHELLHQILAALSRGGVSAKSPLLDDLVEQPLFLGCKDFRL